MHYCIELEFLAYKFVIHRVNAFKKKSIFLGVCGPAEK